MLDRSLPKLKRRLAAAPSPGGVRARRRERQRAGQSRYRARQREAVVASDGPMSSRTQGGSAFDLRITF
jgi:hypothetical protein